MGSMNMLDILKRYTNPTALPDDNVQSHFDSVVQGSDPKDLTQGIAAAMRSDATPSFGQTIGNLFERSDPHQKAGVLNEILQSVGPGALAGGGGLLSRIFGAATGAVSNAVTPEQASQVAPADLTKIATQAEQQDGSIIDRLSGFYARHPTLVKTLGVAALSAVMSHMSRQPQGGR